MSDDDWNSSWIQVLGLQLNGDAMEILNERGEHVTDDNFLLLLNAHHESVRFKLPRLPKHGSWTVVFDTSQPDPPRQPVTLSGGGGVPLQGRSLMLLCHAH